MSHRLASKGFWKTQKEDAQQTTKKDKAKKNTHKPTTNKNIIFTVGRAKAHTEPPLPPPHHVGDIHTKEKKEKKNVHKYALLAQKGCCVRVCVCACARAGIYRRLMTTGTCATG